MAKRRFGMHAGAHRSGAPKGERNGNYLIGNSLSKSPLSKASLLTRPDVRKLMETAPGSVHPSVMVCGTVAFRDRRVSAQVAPKAGTRPTHHASRQTLLLRPCS
jgi:hypothetical protein